LQIAKELRLEVFVHARNYGYGGNQKTCYTEALKAGADIVVMLHPDYQYDPMLLPNVVAPIKAGRGGRCPRLAVVGWRRDSTRNALVEVSR
jgi:Glycosyl transferase family 2